jgi:hypothetical protein
VLNGILKELKIVPSSLSDDDFDGLGTHHWKSVFALDRLRSKRNMRCRFTGTMNSDGVSACFHMCKPKAASVHRGYRTRQEDNVAVTSSTEGEEKKKVNEPTTKTMELSTRKEIG